MTKNTLWGIILDEQLYSEASRAKFVRSPRERYALFPARRHGQSGWCASQALRAWRGQNSGRAPTRAASSRVAAQSAPVRASYALPTSDSPLRSPLGDMDRADGARLRRCAHGAAKTPAVRPRAACSRVAAHIAPRAKFVHSSGERFAALIRSATWTERMVRVSGVARMAQPKLRRCAHTRGVFTRRRSECAPRALFPVGGADAGLLGSCRDGESQNRAPRSKKLLRPRAPRFFAAERGRYDKADNQMERTRHAA